MEKGNLISNDKILAKTFNHFYLISINITSDLGLKDCQTSGRYFENLENLLGSFKDNPSVKRIKTSFQTSDGFIFKEVNQEEVRQEIIDLDGSKATMCGDIPADIVKSSINIHLDFLTDIIKKSLRDGEFPNILKYDEAFPINKNEDHLYKENCRLVSVLLHISQKSERLMYKQIEDFMNRNLLPLRVGFRKNYRT